MFGPERLCFIFPRSPAEVLKPLARTLELIPSGGHGDRPTMRRLHAYVCAYVCACVCARAATLCVVF